MSNGLKIEILGKEEFERSMRHKTSSMLSSLTAAIQGETLNLHEVIVKSIRKEGTGRVYRRGKTTHKASAPGNPPATDTGNLMSTTSFDMDMRGKSPVGNVVARAPYAAALEFGTRKMDPRPFMKPALINNAARIRSSVRNALNRGVNA